MNQTTEIECGKNSQKVNLDIPNECSICHVSLLPTVLHSQLVKLDDNKYEIAVIFYCPNCKNTFFAKYLCSISPYGVIVPSEAYKPNIYPARPRQLIQYEQIKTLSPKFLDIYAQAQQAEIDGLDELCGMGYRKALEFLVKDYAIYCNPDDSDKIVKLPLLKCITEYIDDEGIKALSVVSTWLGNGEAHYERQNHDLDVQTMKNYINSITFFICMKLNVIEAKNYIDSKKN